MKFLKTIIGKMRRLFAPLNLFSGACKCNRDEIPMDAEMLDEVVEVVWLCASKGWPLDAVKARMREGFIQSISR